MRNFSKLSLVALIGLLIPLTHAHAQAKEAELPDSIHSKVVQLSREGDSQSDDGHYREAVEKYIEAFELLPEPRTDWEASTRLLGAMGDANFQSGNYQQAKAALSDAMKRPGAIGNPFLHLRLGQTQFELGNMERAKDELTRAYMGAGKEIFAQEDPKYFAHLKTVLRPPANGEW